MRRKECCKYPPMDQTQQRHDTACRYSDEMADSSDAALRQAEMELALIVATVFRRYEFELYQDELETREGFLRKPLGLKVGMRKRAGVL